MVQCPQIIMLIAAVLIISSVSAKLSKASYFYNSERPILIAHRGACGYFPEHTLEAYKLAEYMGSDFIEPDLVPTLDHHLIANHEGELSETTNISELPEYGNLYTTKTIFGYMGEKKESGWFSEDLFLSQIKNLRAKQRLPSRSQNFNNMFGKVTIDEILDWALSLNEKRSINNKNLLGVYIELKEPGYYNSLGFKVEDLLLAALKVRGIDNVLNATARCPIVFQSFEIESLEYLAKFTDLPLVYLIETGYLKMNISQYHNIVHGVGPDFEIVFNSDGSSTEFVKEAHSYNLSIHPFVVRDDRPLYGWSRKQIYENIFKASIDGIFDEFPKSAQEYFSLKVNKQHFEC